MGRLALVVSLVSICCGFWLGHQTRATPRTHWVTRLVLARDVAAGAPLGAEDLKPFSTPADAVDDTTVPSDAQPLVLGKALAHPRTAGELVHFAELVEPEAPVQKKARAAVLDITARSPWVKKGDHLDVLASFNDPQTNELVTVTLMQNVIVLGTEKLEKGQRLSLLIIPEEAELLLEAQRLGVVEVTLRNEDDVDVLEERGRATVNTLLSGERQRVLLQKRFDTTCLRGAR